MPQIARIRGFRDIISTDSLKYSQIASKLHEICASYGYNAIETPIVESAALYHRSVGEGSEIVSKEMFYLENNDDRVCMRPEGTAGTMRMHLEVYGSQPGRHCYYGPMFRMERPQKGRFRQFGIECIGSEGPLYDAEAIELGYAALNAIGLEGRFTINSLGGQETQQKFSSLLRQYLMERSAELSDTSRRRLQQGWVLRILDSKLEADVSIISECPKMHDSLNDSEKKHFELVLEALHKRQIEYSVDAHLVRGLDYYGGLVFEFESADSEASGRHTLLGGGRYDGLSRALGGSYSLPSVGWALGVDRCALLLPAASLKRPKILIFSMEGADDASASIAASLRSKQIATVIAYSAELKDLKKLISSTMATHCVFIGSKELQSGTATIKDTASFEQRSVSLAELPDIFMK